MKKLIFILFILPVQLFALSTTYYVSSSTGNDGNPGTISLPFASISKVNSVIVAGDNVNFMRGDTFYGTITRPPSNTLFTSYGTGANPIITGFISVTSWTNLGSNIWEATVTGGLATCNMVSINGVNTPMGRYPNTTFLTAEAGSNGTSMISSTLTGTPNWSGADLVSRHVPWSVNRCKISAQSGSTLTYSSNATETVLIGGGFFIQNAAATLDVQNEWYYYDNAGTKKLQIYSTTSPVNVKAATRDSLVNMDYNGYPSHTTTSFVGIDFVGSNSNLIKSYSSINTTFDSCNFSFAGKSAIEYGNGATNGLTITNSTFSDMQLAGIFETSSSNVTGVTIRNNLFKRIGLYIGMVTPIGGFYTSGNSGMAIAGGGANWLVKDNVIDSTGYNGISMRQNKANVTVRRNKISNYCLNKNDGGGIYNGGQRGQPDGSNVYIDSNIVFNSGDAQYGTGQATPHSRPIYLDATSSMVRVLHNTVFNGYGGIYTCYGYNNLIRDNNILFGGANNNPWYEGMLQINQSGSPYGLTYNDTLVNNTIVATTSTNTMFLAVDNAGANINTYGKIDSNNYVNSGSVVVKPFAYNYGASLSLYSNLIAWNSAYGYEAAGKYYTPAISNVRFEYNATGTASAVNLGGYNYTDLTGATNYPGTVTIQPFSSIIMLKGSAISHTSPTANVGTYSAITLPVNTVNLTGSGIAYDGATITGYLWSGSGATFSNSAISNPVVTFSTSGTKAVTLTVTDSMSATGSATTNIIVNSAIIVVPPTPTNQVLKTNLIFKKFL